MRAAAVEAIGVALVEFVRFEVADFPALVAGRPERWKPARYVAFVLLAEEPNIQNVVGNIWPCVCNGPKYSSTGSPDLYQVDPSPDAKNFGNDEYGIHSHRFNYLFHDNHVEALRIEQTMGSKPFELQAEHDFKWSKYRYFAELPRREWQD